MEMKVKKMIMVVVYANSLPSGADQLFWDSQAGSPFAGSNFAYSLSFEPKPETPRIFHGLDAYPEFFLPTPSPQHH